MAVIVVGCGRSGTNAMLEALRGSRELEATPKPESKNIFQRKGVLQQNLLTKCDTAYFNEEDMTRTISMNYPLKIVWMLRDPRDMVMSKLRRGVTEEDGGDCKSLADDATPDGAIADIEDMLKKYRKAMVDVGWHCALPARLEHLLLEPERTLRRVCEHVEIDYCQEMLLFPSRMRNKKKAERYSKIDTSQVGMYKRWRTVYDGWLERYDMKDIFERLEPTVRALGYEI